MAMTGPRGARADELPAVVELSNSVFRAGGGFDMGSGFPLLFSEENAENLRLFLDGDRPVSLVGACHGHLRMMGARVGVCAVGSVCTAHDYRGQGLATRLMNDARERAVARGCSLMMVSGGRGLYRRLGYVEGGRAFTFTVSARTLPRVAGYRVRPAEPDDAPALTRLHMAEPLRFERTPGEFRAMLASHQVMAGPGATYVACRRGEAPSAYVSVQLGREADAPTVYELGGARRAAVPVFAELLTEHDLKELTVAAHECDMELRAMASGLGWATRERPFWGTLGIIDTACFLNAMRPALAERLGPQRAPDVAPADDGVRLSLGDETLHVRSWREATRLFFEAGAGRAELLAGLAADSPLRSALAEALPWPVPDYGLNYV